MSWTGRSEGEACCPGPNGPVRTEERLARLLHTRNLEPNYDPFARRELFPPKGGGYDNTCGDADGISVVRCSELSDENLRKRAQSQADIRPGRQQEGALLAEVQAVRSARAASFPNQQIAFVYDDAKQDDDLHAAVRGIETADRPEQDEIREAVRRAFAKRVDRSP